LAIVQQRSNPQGWKKNSDIRFESLLSHFCAASSPAVGTLLSWLVRSTQKEQLRWFHLGTAQKLIHRLDRLLSKEQLCNDLFHEEIWMMQSRSAFRGGIAVNGRMILNRQK
jgi:hypothetical protein